MKIVHFPDWLDGLRTDLSADKPLRILVSGCIAGLRCGVDGSDYGLGAAWREFLALPTVAVTAFCPEDHALGTPRSMPDIHGGDGHDVLTGNARVLDENGEDLTEAMVSGARAMVEAAEEANVELCILTDMSGACGSQVISLGCRYDEVREYQLGQGVAAAALMQKGFPIVSQRDHRTLARLRQLLDPDYCWSPEADDPVDHQDHPWVAGQFTAEERGARWLHEEALSLVTRFGVFGGPLSTEEAQRRLLALGPAAVPALLTVVHKAGPGERGWVAAKLLGQIGHTSEAVLNALREHAATSHWHATALGLLGDHEFLASEGGSAAVHGFTAPLRAVATSAMANPPPLYYGPLERWLEQATEDEISAVEELLKPGRSYTNVSAEDVDEALRGLGSPRPVIRWHAASALRRRDLPRDLGQAVIAKLGRALKDPHHFVRRLAVLSLGSWMDVGGDSVRTMLSPMKEDENEVVRRLTVHVLSNDSS